MSACGINKHYAYVDNQLIKNQSRDVETSQETWKPVKRRKKPVKRRGNQSRDVKMHKNRRNIYTTCCQHFGLQNRVKQILNLALKCYEYYMLFTWGFL